MTLGQAAADRTAMNSFGKGDKDSEVMGGYAIAIWPAHTELETIREKVTPVLRDFHALREEFPEAYLNVGWDTELKIPLQQFGFTQSPKRMESQVSNTEILLQSQEAGQPVVKARQVSLVAKDVRVLLFEQPVQEGAAALRTLASQVLQAEAPREFQIGWEIAGDQLVLKTDASEGTMYSLPENFVLDQKQRDASHYQIGHFQRDGLKWILLIEIKAKAEKERITKRIVRPTRVEELKRVQRMESKPPSPQWVPASPFKDATTPAADSDSLSQTLELEMTDVKDETN